MFNYRQTGTEVRGRRIKRGNINEVKSVHDKQYNNALALFSQEIRLYQ